MKRDVPVRRSAQLLLVDVVGRDRQLARVVEQVVEQDLRRQHRQERQEQRRPGGREHVPEVARRPHQHVLDGVGEDPPALGDAVGQHVEVLLEQDDVGGVLGDVGRRVDRDADVGGVQGQRVVDAVAQERDRAAAAPLDADDAGLVLGADPGEDRRVAGSRAASASSSSRSRSAPVSARAPSVSPRSRHTLTRHGRVVAGDRP